MTRAEAVKYMLENPNKKVLQKILYDGTIVPKNREKENTIHLNPYTGEFVRDKETFRFRVYYKNDQSVFEPVRTLKRHTFEEIFYLLQYYPYIFFSSIDKNYIFSNSDDALSNNISKDIIRGDWLCEEIEEF